MDLGRQTVMGTLAILIKLQIKQTLFLSDRLTSLVVIATGGLLLPHLELQAVQCLT